MSRKHSPKNTHPKKIQKIFFGFFFSVSMSAPFFLKALRFSNLTAIATWRGEMSKTHCHKHFEYSKHGQSNGAVA